jgi:NAD(P)-dependent dehydrogenase (short-subunit alcohol dehydrogenase family)
VSAARSSPGRLAGRVVIVSDSQLDVARLLAAEGASVVAVGPRAAAMGEAVVAIESGPGRVAVFAGDLADVADRAALCELIDEVFARDA